MRGEACRPCRQRKLRCDATITGIPCARCQDTSRVNECIVPPRQKRTINRHKRARIDSNRDNGRREEHQNRSPTPIVDDLTPARAPADHGIQTPRTGHVSGDVLSGVHIATSPTDHFAIADLASAPTPNFDYSQIVGTQVNGSSLIAQTSLPDDNGDDVLARVCQEMASPFACVQGTNMGASWAKAIEYHNCFNAAGIIGEVLAGRDSNKFITIDRGALRTRREDELRGLDEHDVSYLQHKGVFDLPPREVCLEMFKIYFQHAYPYAPVIDRGDFLVQFSRGEYSMFLVQALFANVTPYLPKDLVGQASFPDHATAQKIFYRRAVLLYDFNCEKSQLVLLQGSLLLGTLWRSYFSDKDYSFWMCNAARLAIRMGLNKRCIANELGARFYTLLKRVWWTLYIRDVLTTVSGLENNRHLRAEECDTSALAEDDWPDDKTVCPQDLIHILPSVQSHHKDFLIHLCHLAAIGDLAHSAVLSCPAAEIDKRKVAKLIDDTYEWRLNLPRSLRMESVRDWENEGIWVLVLMAWCYRLECMLYRTLRKAYVTDSSERERMTEMLHRAIFELDAIVRRAVTHRIGQLLPMSFSTAVATLIALCIELLLKPDLRPSDKLMSEEAIRTGIAFLVACQETWPSLRWMLKMFDWAFAQAGLDLRTGVHLDGPMSEGQGLSNGQTNITSENLFSADASIWPFTESHLFGAEFMLNTNGFATWQN